MSEMFCYQCQETAKNTGCDTRGVCGKSPEVSNLQDLLIYLLKGVSTYTEMIRDMDGEVSRDVDVFVMKGLFSTVTNVNFSADDFYDWIGEALEIREELAGQCQELYREKHGEEYTGDLPEAATWTPDSDEDIEEKAKEVGVLQTENEDVRSLRELLIYGLKGIAAYADHAYILGHEQDDIYEFMQHGLAATLDESLSGDELTNLVLECGDCAVDTMALLDEANTSTYGHPEPTEVDLSTDDRPGILVSGHDLKDFEELLEQSEGEGVDIYTHGEMLPAQAYPAFKKYDHFKGNYGGSWWKQKEEFEKFNGPILMTTNCIVPPKDSYKDRIYTTGVAGFEGVSHIEDRPEGGSKDFTPVIEAAKKTKPPQEIESGSVMTGFAHNALSERADAVVEAIQNGDISRFVVMSGCDGRFKDREYFTEVAKELPEDAIILTSGCAKFRYNKLELGDIGGIPRVLDAGQCNDSYSLVVVAKKLAEAVDADDINDLPISYDIAWYEQKAVAVLLGLLAAGVKDIKLGPTLPAFLSENVTSVLVDKFGIAPTSGVQEDVKELMA
ncbi:hydroxylamine reductase [Halarsenatibacter silvermanii]|uniref:Hydroxylamine reductase n=2 Tax=Halarsenatibacter silvermanii TaxID=321763 RepID=A0A1G9KX94_9FIRM|nr:hydroxylamine reductase [Halarsenatibacter silvermanii]SDL54490.1 hydroxylamine reductase [Halarsenatibacter silvermanii]